jgi:hypothetical protein
VGYFAQKKDQRRSYDAISVSPVGERALDVLAPVIRDSGEILQVEAPIKDMFGFHVTRVIENAVDMDASKIQSLPTGDGF